MFSKSRPETDMQPSASKEPAPPPPAELRAAAPQQPGAVPERPKPKPAASVLSSDLTITGNVRSSGDIQIEGNIDGDVRSHTLIVGDGATVKGEVVAEEVIVNGRVVGRLRGLKVRLSNSARVEGDIVHKTIAIESGAHFEGSVQRQEDPLGQNAARKPQSAVAAPGTPQPQAAQPAQSTNGSTRAQQPA